MEYIQTAIAFITGGGLFAIISIRYTSMTAKVDAYSKMENFWQESNEKIRIEFKLQIVELERRISDLETKECKRIECKNRLKA